MLSNRLLVGLAMLLTGPLSCQAAPKFETQGEYIRWMYHNAPVVNEIMVKFKPGSNLGQEQ